MTEKTLTLAEALRELKRVSQLLQQRYINIQRYCSKKKGLPDEITNQKGYVKEQVQSAEDLLKYYTKLKLALNLANLTTTFEFDGETYSVAEAILYKQFLSGEYAKLYNSFNPTTANAQIGRIQLPMGMQLTQEQLSALNLVPELFYNEKIVQAKREKLMAFMSAINASIDRVNHSTTITV